LGAIDFADLIFLRSEQHVIEMRRQLAAPDWEPGYPILFGAKEGRIARAHRGKEPLFMFSALQRHLGYPAVPRQRRNPDEFRLSPAALEARLTQLEKRVQLIEAEEQGTLDLSRYYERRAETPPGGADIDGEPRDV
jgi:hypothetical protein